MTGPSRYLTTEQRQHLDREIARRTQIITETDTGRSNSMIDMSSARQTFTDDLGPFEVTDVKYAAEEDAPAVAAAEEDTSAVAAAEADATAKLLAETGFDHVPTVEEAKAVLDARRQEIRKNVLFQADKRDWCEDGTRKVCANLRIERPGSRTTHQVQVELSLILTVESNAYSPEGAIARLRRNGVLAENYLKNHLYATSIQKNEVVSASMDGEPIDLNLEVQK